MLLSSELFRMSGTAKELWRDSGERIYFGLKHRIHNRISMFWSLLYFLCRFIKLHAIIQLLNMNWLTEFIRMRCAVPLTTKSRKWIFPGVLSYVNVFAHTRLGVARWSGLHLLSKWYHTLQHELIKWNCGRRNHVCMLIRISCFQNKLAHWTWTKKEKFYQSPINWYVLYVIVR